MQTCILGVVQFQSHLGLIYVYSSRHRVRRCRDTAKDVCDRGADHYTGDHNCVIIKVLWFFVSSVTGKEYYGTGDHFCVIVKVLRLFNVVLWLCDWQDILWQHQSSWPNAYMHAFPRPAAQSGYMFFLITIITADTAISCVTAVRHESTNPHDYYSTLRLESYPVNRERGLSRAWLLLI